MSLRPAYRNRGEPGRIGPVNVLAIDQGTSATKALVVSERNEVLSEVEVPVHPRPTPDGGVEQDPEELWRSVLEAGARAIERAGVEVGAVGFDNQGETVLAWDRRSTEPRSTAISWQDARAVEVCRRLAGRAEELRAITGLPLDPYFSAPKIAWLRDHVTTEGVATTTDAWLLARLCGAYVTDPSTASRTMLLDLDGCRWSAEACAAFDIDPRSLPEIAPNAGVVGWTSAFGGRLPVSGIAVDQQAALFAQGCHGAGEGKCTYGTGAFLQVNVGEETPRSRSGLLTCVAWVLDGAPSRLLEGQVYTVGAAVTWLREVGLIARASDLDDLGGTVEDSGGVTFVPGLAGMAAPFWRREARGAFTGLSLSTTRAHLVRAVVEGVAAAVSWLAKGAADDLGTPLRRLRVDGGLTRSRVLMQTQADLLGAPVDVYPSPNATALGSAALARLGMGAASSPAEAIGDWTPAATFEPRASAESAERRLGRWRAAAAATIELGS